MHHMLTKMCSQRLQNKRQAVLLARLTGSRNEGKRLKEIGLLKQSAQLVLKTVGD